MTHVYDVILYVNVTPGKNEFINQTLDDYNESTINLIFLWERKFLQALNNLQLLLFKIRKTFFEMIVKDQRREFSV